MHFLQIPMIKDAISARGDGLKLFASPWTAPPWMKSNNDYRGFGYLLKEYYQPWAEYFVKFLDGYAAEGVDFWGVTAQNEPSHGRAFDSHFNCMGWGGEDQREFVGNNLGPALEEAGYGEVKLMIYDDQKPFVLNWTRTVRVFES